MKHGLQFHSNMEVPFIIINCINLQQSIEYVTDKTLKHQIQLKLENVTVISHDFHSSPVNLHIKILHP